jgi:uncharacterized repeat protein (TIGR03803 family)
VFKINRDGTGYTVLHSFTGTIINGWPGPDPDLIEGSDGKLYGTTEGGGTNGAGTVFQLNKDGSGYTLLQTSTSGGSGLVFGSDGALYGATSRDGSNYVGTVFRLNTDGEDYSTLYIFGANTGDGWFPTGLMEGAGGALYGTTSGGGAYTNQYGAGMGTVFKLNKDGSGYSVLYSFGNTANDGQTPLAGLTQGSDGALYGTTANGGEMNFGTVFKIWPPETPDLIGVTSVDNNVQVSFAGISGAHYQVLRSTDLASWSVQTNITMPSTGVYTNFDNSPPNSRAYYRAVWKQ